MGEFQFFEENEDYIEKKIFFNVDLFISNDTNIIPPHILT